MSLVNKIPDEMIRVSSGPLIEVDIRYASENNFTGRNLYGDFTECYLHREAHAKFQAAQEILVRRKPGYKFLVFDALRPRSVQYVLWDYVKGTSQEKYIANPDEGSVHNYGFAIDLSLMDDSDREVDMGTIFDFFGDLAEPQHEARFFAEGLLTDAHLENRRLLRSVMEEAGFRYNPYEWWHFDALSRKEIRAGGYSIID